VTSPVDRKEEIDAQLRAIDLSLEELQTKRRALLEERRRMAAGVAQPGAAAPPPGPAMDEKALNKALNLLEWTGFKKKDGEWTFLRDRQGGIVEGLQSAPEFVAQVRKGKEVIVGKYRYRASDDKFLNRFIE